MIYHIVVGDLAATPLQEAVSAEPSMNGEVVVLKDILHVGPLRKEEGVSFSAMRSAFWNTVTPNEKSPARVEDLERLLDISTQLSKSASATVWYWMAPAPADVCGYYWMLGYLSKHTGRLHLVNIAGLPFLNEAGKVYYPKSFGDIPPREIIKARKLARLITPSEMEVDTEEWQRITEDNAAIRTHEGGKKIVSREVSYYDKQLVSFCSHQFQKASRIVQQAMSKYSIPTGDLYLGWRLREIAASGELQLQGDVTKLLKDFELRLQGAPAESAGVEETADNA